MPPPHKLHEILVGGDDNGLQPGIFRQRGIGGDQIVSLETRNLELRQAERCCCLAHKIELRHQLFGRIGAVRLVRGIDVIAKGLAG